MSLLPVLLKLEVERLFPNSPIEVQVEGERFTVYCEGEWYDNCESVADVQWTIQHLITMYADDWLYQSCRINPEWVGWPKVSPCALVLLAELAADKANGKKASS